MSLLTVVHYQAGFVSVFGSVFASLSVVLAWDRASKTKLANPVRRVMIVGGALVCLASLFAFVIGVACLRHAVTASLYHTEYESLTLPITAFASFLAVALGVQLASFLHRVSAPKNPEKE